MKNFLDEDFLLENETAKTLYHNYAKDMPIYDYHCHVIVDEILKNKSYENITQVWLYGDHYKWRFMRSMGIDEKYITGDASDYEKFLSYAKVVPYALGNPLYHWTHLELKRFFGIEEILNEENAEIIWEKSKEKLQSGNFNTRDLIKMSNVKGIVSTDDPVDSLDTHIKLKNKFDVSVTPGFRPDKAINIDKDTFFPWLEDLAKAAKCEIKDYNSFSSALLQRVEFFHSVGCKFSDHAFEYVPFEETTLEEVAEIFNKKLSGKEISKTDVDKFKTYTMRILASEFAKKGWVMQLHIGALRNNNTKMFNVLGPDTGFDSVHDYEIAYKLSKFLDNINEAGNLPKTVLYTLNPKDNYVLGTMLGNFQDGKIAGKIQFGSGWWFNDQKAGMIQQMTDLANLGALSKFIGMLTDSRSFLSYTRHEYFRRILCNLIGSWVENGEYPNDIKTIGTIVQDICYNNIEAYIKA